MHSRRLFLAAVLVVCCFLSGCATSSFHNDFSNRPQFIDDYPKIVYGKYLGDVSFEGNSYRHFYFDVFPWPTYPSRNYMHLFVPERAGGEIHVFNAPRDFDAIKGYGPPRTPQHYYSNNSLIYLEADKNPGSDRYLEVVLLIVNGGTDAEAKAYYDSKAPHARFPLIMKLDMDGPGTEVRMGALTEELVTLNGRPTRVQKTLWEPDVSTVQSKPYRGGWYSPWGNIAYLFTVPIDILTSPFQAIYYAFGYRMMRGMSPT